MNLAKIYKDVSAFRISVSILLIAIFSVPILDFFALRMSAKIQERRAVLQSSQNIQLNFEEILSSFNRVYESYNEKISGIRPTKQGVVAILEGIEKESAVRKIGVTFNNVTVDDTKFKDIVKYRARFSANVTQFLSFIQIMANLPAYVQIERVEIKEVNDFDFYTRADYEVIFIYYVMPDEQ